MRKIKRFFKNVYLWFPILISDEQWDYGYIYEVLNHKLKLTEDFFRGDNTHVLDAEKYADEIKEVREILDRLIEEDYMSEEANEYYKSLRMIDFNNRPSNKENVMRWFKEEQDALNKDKKLLYELLEEKLEGWWD